MICQSVDTLFLTATPSGGLWEAEGISEENELTGWYLPELVTTLQDTVTYTDTSGCSAQIIVDLIPLDDGNDDAACPGSDPFFVSGGLPSGGTWSGPFIQADGLVYPARYRRCFYRYLHPP